jgi:hypothetical protein
VLLLWPPIFQGIEVGNVAVFTGLLFALGTRIGAGLVVTAIFKLYSGLAGLWLLREGRRSQFAAGIALIVGLALITLPVTGLDRWREWLAGLDWYRASQPLLPASLYGFGLPRYVPFLVFVIVAVAVAAAALRGRGDDGLARLGIATIVASPSLYSHGVIVAMPSVLRLDTLWLWVTLGVTSVAPGLGWWIAITALVVAWFGPFRRPAPADAVDVDEAVRPDR